MTYQFVYSRRAERDIDKLDAAAQKRIKKKLEEFKHEPFRYAEKLSSSDLGSYRFRIGDYRVIFDAEGANLVVLRVGHRREIYR
ncbi:MAG: type II toxin-antitoxin system RelE/ParE family toxin [candidate division KSB1 bacterium]|nr:type II toxin-antitoxin system RelE/ParE family toxin [candidate division KSB1 bacterium]MDZ7303265.1 type II toxin-antitoxin system RelE/ParE family toxin [candidate division KSB1 bacterium]MDZ7312569.1 type II toxin-antitoxin system RelE/ParE family toxin [candidate division KSB1 bacterium]